MEQHELRQEIQSFINEKIAPGVWAHGGEVNIVSFENQILTIALAGSCGSCSVQAYTADAITDYILEEFADVEDVIVIDTVGESEEPAAATPTTVAPG
jgi:Fe/S biogenesis protein NfuA